MLAYIPDGYTESGYIRAERGIHPALRFTFRPMLGADKTVIMDLVLDPKKKRDQDRIMAAALKERLVDWDLHDAAGKSVPISTDVIGRLKPRLFTKLFMVVSGSEAGDHDPDQDEDAREASDEDFFEAAIAGHGIGHYREERDEKNSVAA